MSVANIMKSVNCFEVHVSVGTHDSFPLRRTYLDYCLLGYALCSPVDRNRTLTETSVSVYQSMEPHFAADSNLHEEPQI